MTEVVTRLIQVITMALFSKDISEDEVLDNYNIFEGIECTALLPEKQLKTTGKSGATKGLATFAFGFVGLAATSGMSQNEENREIQTILQIVDKGIVLKNGTIDGADLRIPYSKIVKTEAVPYKNKYHPALAIITLLKNKRIIITADINLDESNIVMNHLANVTNERACGAQYEEAGWGLEHATAEPQETKQESGSLMDELERLGNMYKEGLLTDEEFAAMKKKLIEER